MNKLLQMLRNRRARREIYSRPDFWNGKADEFEGDAVSMWPNNHLNEFYQAEQLAVIDAALPELTGQTVLDLGCGTGRIARHLAARGAQVVGVDFADKAIAIAQKLSAGNPRYEVGSMFELSGDAVYDAVVSWGSVTIACRDVAELRAVATGLRRVIKPGGHLLLLEPIHRGFLHRVLDLDVTGFCRVFTEAGFREVHVQQLHYWPARLALAYLRWPRWITVPGYHLGQTMLAAFGQQNGGDYKAFSARAPVPPTA